MTKSGLKRFAGLVIGGIIFSFSAFYLVYKFQWGDIFDVLLTVDLKWFIGAGTSTIIVYWCIRTLRWYILLKAVNVHINFFNLYIVSAMSLAFTIITPMQSGEALKIELFKKKGVLDRSAGYATFMTERLADLIVVLFIAILSLFVGILKLFDKSSLLIASGALLACFAIFLGVIRRIPSNNPLGRFFQPFNQCLGNTKTMLGVFALTAAGWLVVSLGWYVSLKSISISLSFLQTVSLTSIITVIQVISFIPGGIGVSEVGIASLLVLLNQNVLYAQTGGLILRAYGLLALTLGFIHYICVVVYKGHSKYSKLP